MAQSFAISANATSYKVGITCVHTYINIHACTCTYKLHRIMCWYRGLLAIIFTCCLPFLGSTCITRLKL